MLSNATQEEVRPYLDAGEWEVEKCLVLGACDLKGRKTM